jgi:hypothetical protein
MDHQGKAVSPAFRAFCLAAVLVLLLAGSSRPPSAAEAHRPPAVPLVACDPYFSVWSFGDRLTDSDTVHWTGTRQALSSLIQVDGKAYRLLGTSPPEVPALSQVGLEVLPTRTLYEFEGAGIHVSLIFMTAMLPDDLEVLSRPVTYITWKLRSEDGKGHSTALYFDTSAELVVNTTDESVVWSHEQVAGLNVVRMGTEAQPILAKSGDDRRIDWGYLYLALPTLEESQSVIAEGSVARSQFAWKGSLPRQDDAQMPRPAADRMPVMAAVYRGIKVGPSQAERHLLLLYDDIYSVELLHRRLRPYWRAHGAEAKDLLGKAARDYAGLQSKCGDFDREFMEDLTSIGGSQYAELAALAYRQSLAASKIAAAPDGKPLFFEKENFSDGSISTPDVLFPQSPILLLFNPTLLRASLVPIFEYATSGRWKFPFAPAQLGTYPLANGQTYGGGETSEEGQQPVEETGDMLIMTAAVARMEGRPDLAAQYWPVLQRWAEYLRAKGFDPEKQLCTDDFAGPLAHNANLALKSIEALGAYALLCDMRGEPGDAASYRKTAEEFARKWMTMARDGDHFRLAFDQPGTWSQKYNLVWDRLLGLNLFPREIARSEVAYYERRLLAFGCPLDSRSKYTKLDWEVWSASLADAPADFQKLMSPVFDFVDQTPSRVPLPDWYYATDGKQCLYHTKAGRQIGFQARPVVGGVFMKVLMDAPTWKKWSDRAGMK